MYLRYVIAYSIMVTFSILFTNYQYDKVHWTLYFLTVVFWIPFAWMMSPYYLKQLPYDSLDDDPDDPDLGQPIMKRARMIHFRGIFADDGIGYILQDRFIFIPNKLNWTKKPKNILLSDVKCILDCKILGIFNKGLKIEMKSGKIEKFAVDKTSSFYDMLINRFPK